LLIEVIPTENRSPAIQSVTFLNDIKYDYK
jgi:hypothetical protein